MGWQVLAFSAFRKECVGIGCVAWNSRESVSAFGLHDGVGRVASSCESVSAFGCEMSDVSCEFNLAARCLMSAVSCR